MYANEEPRYSDGDMWNVASRRQQSDSLGGYQHRAASQYSASQMTDTGGYGYQQSSVSQPERNGHRLRQVGMSPKRSNLWDDYDDLSAERGSYQGSGNNYDMVSRSASSRPVESVPGLMSHQAEPNRNLYSQAEQDRYGSFRQTSGSSTAWNDGYSSAQPLMERDSESWMYCHACDMSFESKMLYLSHCQERFHKNMVAQKLGGSSRLNQTKKTASVGGYGQMSRQTKNSWTTDTGNDYARMGDNMSSGMSRQIGGMSQMESRQTYSNIDDRAQGSDDWYSAGNDPYGREREVRGYSGSGMTDMTSGVRRELGSVSSGVSGMGEPRRGILRNPQLASDSRRESGGYYGSDRTGQMGSRGDPGRGMVAGTPGRLTDISRIETVDNSFSGVNRFGSRQVSSAVRMSAAERRTRTPVGQMSTTPYRSATTKPHSVLAKDIQKWKKPLGGGVKKPLAKPMDIRISKEQVANALKKIKNKSGGDQQLDTCKVCGVGGSTGININEFHWKGKKHFLACFKAMLELGPKQFFEKYGKIPPTPHATYGTLKAAATKRSPYQKFMYKSGVANAYNCKVCASQLPSLDMWVKHVTSDEHKEKCNQLLQKDGLELFLNDYPTTPAPFLTDDETVKTLPGYEDLEARFPHGDDKPAAAKEEPRASAGTTKADQGKAKQPEARPQVAGQGRKEDNRMTSEQKRPGTQGTTASGAKAKKQNASGMRATVVRLPVKRGMERGTPYGMAKTRRIEGSPGMRRTNAPQTLQRRPMGGRPLMSAAPVQPLFPEGPRPVPDAMRRQQMVPARVPQLLDDRPARFMGNVSEPMPQAPMPQAPMPQVQQQAGLNPRALAMQLQQFTGVTDSDTIMQAVNILTSVNLQSLQGMTTASLDVLQRMIPMVQELGELAGMDSQPLINQLTDGLMQGRLNPNDLLRLLQQARGAGGVGSRRPPPQRPSHPRPLPLMRPGIVRIRGRSGYPIKGNRRVKP